MTLEQTKAVAIHAAEVAVIYQHALNQIALYSSDRNIQKILSDALTKAEAISKPKVHKPHLKLVGGIDVEC